MKNLTLILKGILLYTTGIMTAWFICSVDSIHNWLLFPILGLIILGIYLCYKVLTKEDIDILSGYKLFREEENDEM